MSKDPEKQPQKKSAMAAYAAASGFTVTTCGALVCFAMYAAKAGAGNGWLAGAIFCTLGAAGSLYTLLSSTNNNDGGPPTKPPGNDDKGPKP